ncbi:MAG: hypothetical protein LBV52_06850 [Spirochaetaceae bacterium]|jgi:hypothetical protein|nr:hypothetical protein [Spirochaetaceae bacterium]
MKIKTTIALLFLFSACVSNTTDNINTSFPSVPFVPYKQMDKGLPFTIENYQGKENGRQLPAWLDVYLLNGVHGVENLPAYNGKYCFVLEQSGSSLDILNRFEDSFKVGRNFTQMSFDRIFQNFIKDSNTAPDILYGSSFKKIMTIVSSSSWNKPVHENSFWLFLHWTGNDEDMIDTYKIYILTSIEKSVFQNQFKSITNAVVADKTDGREQVSAFSRKIDDFFDTF